MQLPMAKVQVISTHRHLESTLDALQDLGAVQLEDTALSSRVLVRLPYDQLTESKRETLSYLLVRLDSVLSSLSPQPLSSPSSEYEAESRHSFDALVDEIRASLDTVRAEVEALTRRRDELVAESQSLPRYEATIRRLMPLATQIPHLDRFETVALLIDRDFEAVLDSLREEAAFLTDQQLEIVSGSVDEQTIGAILVFPKEYSSAVHNLLGQERISQIRLPAELVGVPLPGVLSALRTRLDTIPAQIAEIDTELMEVSELWYGKLAVWRAVVRDRLAALDARELLAATQHTFVVTGWIPQRAIPTLRQTLHDRIGEELVVMELALTPKEREDAPIILENPPIVQPFESLIRLLALPRYNTIDPSALMTFFMPLFFGMILGDIAYGLVVLGLAIWLRRRFSGILHDLGGVFLLSGAWAIIFGFLYGEFLGSFGEVFGLHPYVDRAEALVPLFVTAVAMGMIQVLLGVLLGLWVAIRKRHLKHMSEKVGMLISLMALFALIGVVADYLPDSFFTPLLVVVLIGLVLLSAPMGLIGVLLGPLEFLGAMGNILSYLRIAAIGLSSVYLAEVANEMGGLAGSAILGVIVASLLHILNVALGVISPTIQSLRLHYVEFFGKFFEGGGKPFQPFKRQEFVG